MSNFRFLMRRTNILFNDLMSSMSIRVLYTSNSKPPKQQIVAYSAYLANQQYPSLIQKRLKLIRNKTITRSQNQNFKKHSPRHIIVARGIATDITNCCNFYFPFFFHELFLLWKYDTMIRYLDLFHSQIRVVFLYI